MYLNTCRDLCDCPGTVQADRRPSGGKHSVPWKNARNDWTSSAKRYKLAAVFFIPLVPRFLSTPFSPSVWASPSLRGKLPFLIKVPEGCTAKVCILRRLSLGWSSLSSCQTTALSLVLLNSSSSRCLYSPADVVSPIAISCVER